MQNSRGVGTHASKGKHVTVMSDSAGGAIEHELVGWILLIPFALVCSSIAATGVTVLILMAG